MRGLARLRRRHHQRTADLTRHVGAQVDGRHLQDLVVNISWEVDHLSTHNDSVSGHQDKE